MHIVFFGTPPYVLPILDSLHKEFKDRHGNSPIAAVVTQTPKPVGRSKKVEYSAVDTWAHKKNIPVYFDSNELVTDGIEAEIGIVASFGAMIPQEVLEYFPKGLLNVHPSNLPEFRGASPVQAMLITGKDEATVSIMKIDEQMDHGPLLTQFKEEIREDDTTDSLRDRLFERSAEVLIGMMDPYIKGKIQPKSQDDSKASYTKLIKKEDGFIPWNVLQSTMSNQRHSGRDPESVSLPISFIYTKDTKGNRTPYTLNPTPNTLETFIRTMNPWPGVWTKIRIKDKELRLKLLKAHVEKQSVTSHESLVLDEVQLEGKNPVSWRQFKEAYKVD